MVLFEKRDRVRVIPNIHGPDVGLYGRVGTVIDTAAGWTGPVEEEYTVLFDGDAAATPCQGSWLELVKLYSPKPAS